MSTQYPEIFAALAEEFDPGEFAINLVSLYAPTKEGNA